MGSTTDKTVASSIGSESTASIQPDIVNAEPNDTDWLRSLRRLLDNDRQRDLAAAEDKARLINSIDELLGAFPSSVRSPTPSSSQGSTSLPASLTKPLSTPLSPSIPNPQELDRLDWRLYKEGHRAGWIFSNRAPRSLATILEKQDQISIGSFSYRFSGPSDKPRLFVSRVPTED